MNARVRFMKAPSSNMADNKIFVLLLNELVFLITLAPCF